MRQDLTIRKEGGQWCLYTSDGSRKLGCHPSEAEAKAQEAAIKAREAASMGLIPMDEIDSTSGTQVLDNGNVVKNIPLTDLGEEFINGGQTFDITPEAVKQAVANFQARGSSPIPITVGHVNDSGAAAAGWINDIFEGQDGRPWGKVEFLKETWADISAGRYRYFSAEFYPVDVDQKGKEIGFAFEGGAILNKPFFPIRVDQSKRGGAVFTLSRIRTSTSTTSNRGTADGDGGAMTDEEKKAQEAADKKAAEEKLALEKANRMSGDNVTLSREQFQSLLKAKQENDSLRADMVTLRSDKEGQERRIGQLERQTSAIRIRNAIKKLREQGVIVQLGDYAIDHSDTDCIEWLTTAPFGVTTIDGLEKLGRDQEATAHLPRVRLGGEKGAGNDTLPPVDLSTEAGRSEAVRRGVAQLRRMPKEELEPMLARRKQSVEDFIRQELAVNHPTYRKEILEKK